MKFPNFLEFQAFNELRQRMGAEQLGHFEFFDPKVHLTVDERQMLQHGMAVAQHSVRVLADHTLAYKNGRVLLLAPVSASGGEAFHIADCARVQQWLQGLESGWQASTGQPITSVCGDCLQLLRYKGFSGERNRHRHYSLRIQEDFSVAEFFQRYPLHPVYESESSALI